MKQSSHILPGLAFGGCLAIIGAISLGEYSTYQVQDKSWVTGDQASAYEHHYDEQLPIKRFGVNVWAAIEYALFNEGRSGVEIGQAGWLYSSEELKTYSPEQDYTEQNLKQIKTIAAALSKQNIELVIAVIPTKARIYPEHLGASHPSETASARYREFTQWLQSQAIHWAGFKEPMLEAKNLQQVYLRTDTHWTPYGAKVAATHLGRYIAEIDNSLIDDSSLFSTKTESSQSHEGDLMSFIPFRDYFHWMGPQPETIEPQVTHLMSTDNLSDADSLLFAAEPSFEIALVGTSYSANKLWNFPGAIEQQLGQEILNYAEEGKGPIEPMMTYLSSEDFANSPPRLLIWEFPERYLPMQYKTTPNLASTQVQPGSIKNNTLKDQEPSA